MSEKKLLKTFATKPSFARNLPTIFFSLVMDLLVKKGLTILKKVPL